MALIRLTGSMKTRSRGGGGGLIPARRQAHIMCYTLRHVLMHISPFLLSTSLSFCLLHSSLSLSLSLSLWYFFEVTVKFSSHFSTCMHYTRKQCTFKCSYLTSCIRFPYCNRLSLHIQLLIDVWLYINFRTSLNVAKNGLVDHKLRLGVCTDKCRVDESANRGFTLPFDIHQLFENFLWTSIMQWSVCP